MIVTLMLLIFFVKEESFQNHNYSILGFQSQNYDKKYILIGMPEEMKQINDTRATIKIPDVIYSKTNHLLIYLVIMQLGTFVWLYNNWKVVNFIKKMRKQENFGYDMQERPTLQEKVARNNQFIQRRKLMTILATVLLFGLFSPYVLQNPIFGGKFLLYQHLYESFIIVESLLGINTPLVGLMGSRTVEFYSTLSFRQIIGNAFILTYSGGLILLPIIGYI